MVEFFVGNLVFFIWAKGFSDGFATKSSVVAWFTWFFIRLYFPLAFLFLFLALILVELVEA